MIACTNKPMTNGKKTQVDDGGISSEKGTRRENSREANGDNCVLLPVFNVFLFSSFFSRSLAEKNKLLCSVSVGG